MNVQQRMRTSPLGEPLFRRQEPPPPPLGNTFTRIITAQALAELQRTTPQLAAERCWPNDQVVIELLTRAATAPAMTTTAGWAAELCRRVVADGLTALGPASAAAQIFKRALTLVFTGSELISAPGLTASAGFASFVAEGQPIPVRQLALTPGLINPHKLATIAVLTREMIESGNAEALIEDALVQSIGIALDTILFDASPEDATRPTGLRNGIAALVASTAADAFEAVFEDMAALIDAIAPVAGTGPYVLVGSPGRAVALAYRLTNINENLTVFGSSAAGANLYAIAPKALAVAMSATPEVDTGTAATLVMDTAPTQMGGTQIEKSMFQTDSTALKVRWPVSWVLRDPRGFAWVTPTWK
jgi:hypothetical protein